MLIGMLLVHASAAELIKLARFAPGARALLRIRADDPGARCQLGNKYGAEVRRGPGLGPGVGPGLSTRKSCWLAYSPATLLPKAPLDIQLLLLSWPRSLHASPPGARVGAAAAGRSLPGRGG